MSREITECRICGRPLYTEDTGDYCRYCRAARPAPPTPTPTQTDLFGDEHRVSIPGNKPAEEAAELILRMTEDNPDLLQYDTIGEIDRAIQAEALLEAGLKAILLPGPDDEDKTNPLVRYRYLMAKLPARYQAETLRRARQWLLQHDTIRVPAAAIRDAEQHRARIAGAMR